MIRNDGPGAVPVRAGAGAYDVIVEVGAIGRLPDLLRERAPAHRYVVISDSRVAALHSEDLVRRCRDAGLSADLVVFPEGEPSKTREEWMRLTDLMLGLGLGRDACVIAVGGGVTTDLAGFVAATYMRGVPLVQVPTSYLAMIDASVGGKTGIDVPQGKNLVGAFHAPTFVLADPELLSTLSPHERAQGLVEAFKHGAILDGGYFAMLTERAEDLLASNVAAATHAIFRSVWLKADVVSSDERERGRREILNFGHTIGHAIEAASEYAVGHGSAVAAGMLLEAEMGVALGVTRAGTPEELHVGLDTLGLPALPPLDLERVLHHLHADKKARGGRPRYVLLERLGKVAADGGWSREVPARLVKDVLTSRLGTPVQRPGASAGP